ncbi:MAG: type I secretion system permease/ATPase [Hyphomicrobium sp.]|nr:type I secretion system permease/ATPase [Hyphomicrobium sp.]
MSTRARQGMKPKSPVRQALKDARGVFIGVGVFSGIINVLALTGSFYMLQVYDRVLPSHSVPTLIGLTILMAGLYVANGLLDHVRVRLMGRVGSRIDLAIRDKVFDAVRTLPLRSRQSGDGIQPIRDLDNVRGFLSGLGPTAFFDLPWIPIYLAVIFLLHPLLGLFSVAGALILIALTLMTEYSTAGPMKAASASGSRRYAFGESSRRNAEAIRALGIGRRMRDRWSELSDVHLVDHSDASEAASGISSVSKVIRLFLQSGILGLGAYLVIEGKVSPGTIIAASIVMSRALAPIETAISHWRGFVSARQSHQRLVELFDALDVSEADVLKLPPPRQTLAVQGLAVAPPGEQKPVIQGVTFNLKAGDGLGIIGPSASGKSTLARALVGIWQPMRMGGSVRLDGASLDQWDPDELGKHIGYLPQEVSLFEGTIAENISRFDPEATDDSIVKAAMAAGVHEMIVGLPEGYQTMMGDGGMGLSAGQRQRVALARALYGDPFLVILDEPNSNLDTAGDNALTEAIRSVRQRGGIAIVIAHRPSALASVDLVLTMARGQVQAMGEKEEVLRKVLQAMPAPQSQPGTQQQAAPQPAQYAPSHATGPAAAGGTAAALASSGLKIVADRQPGGPA